MTPRAEEVLSYMCGLAPIGETILFTPKAGKRDLGFSKHHALCHIIRKLIMEGAIRRHGGHTYTVLKRPGPTERWWWE